MPTRWSWIMKPPLVGQFRFDRCQESCAAKLKICESNLIPVRKSEPLWLPYMYSKILHCIRRYKLYTVLYQSLHVKLVSKQQVNNRKLLLFIFSSLLLKLMWNSEQVFAIFRQVLYNCLIKFHWVCLLFHFPVFSLVVRSERVKLGYMKRFIFF